VFSRYRRILSHPGAAAFTFSGLLSRYPGSMFNVSLMLLIRIQYDSYAMAGRVAAIGTLVWAAQTVPTARLIDRLGQRAGMIPLVGLHVTGVAIAIVTAMFHGPEAWLWLAAVLASLSGPLGSLTRARWSHILGSDRDIHTAFSLEGILDEILFMTGPALSTVLAYQVYPPAGLMFCTASLLIGITILLSQTSTEPPRRRVGDTGLGLKIPRAVIGVTAIAFALGLVFGSADITIVAFADERGMKPIAGVILAVFSLGSFLGGLLYGNINWNIPLERRIIIASLLATIGFWTMALMPGLILLAAVGFVSCATIAPLIASSDNAIQRSVRKEHLTEGLAWLRIGIGIGVSIGMWLSGLVIDDSDARVGLCLIGVTAISIALIAVAVAHLLGHGFLRKAKPLDVHVDAPSVQPAI